MAAQSQIITVEGKNYRSVSLDEWMIPLAPDHPAREELKQLRLTIATQMEQIDKLERENSELNQQLIKVQLQTSTQVKLQPIGMNEHTNESR